MDFRAPIMKNASRCSCLYASVYMRRTVMRLTCIRLHLQRLLTVYVADIEYLSIYLQYLCSQLKSSYSLLPLVDV